ncbi:TadE/TadG family type IV pilus assembly protein [Sulfoacidibacillus thermotolerans]|uniref:TadE-like domain-containing protein n=1 Tax=Sulfoacidibacillus thermotolerans TaxID=1765684 RepID=A0A2U3DCT3_SULT2|nr:TadE/TadG family type IV pilus assembly protein [Sulfoacidibacillus thermotolerans]PWI59086.1 hypothetical protein BM613_00320 [Sulfoacidibacillus thermotolerans]
MKTFISRLIRLRAHFQSIIYDQQGQALVEAAFVLPLFLLLVLGGITLFFTLGARQAAANAATAAYQDALVGDSAQQIAISVGNQLALAPGLSIESVIVNDSSATTSSIGSGSTTATYLPPHASGDTQVIVNVTQKQPAIMTAKGLEVQVNPSALDEILQQTGISQLLGNPNASSDGWVPLNSMGLTGWTNAGLLSYNGMGLLNVLGVPLGVNDGQVTGVRLTGVTQTPAMVFVDFRLSNYHPVGPTFGLLPTSMNWSFKLGTQSSS